jgi:hypothetical protein
MKLTFNNVLLILLVLGLIYTFCNQNIEGVCNQRPGSNFQGCGDYTAEACVDHQKKNCVWVSDQSPPVPPPPAPEDCSARARRGFISSGGGSDGLIHESGCNLDSDMCIKVEDCPDVDLSEGGCTVETHGVGKLGFTCTADNVLRNDCHCIPALYPCANKHRDCNGHGTDGDKSGGCVCADGWTGTCCTIPPTGWTGPPSEGK